MARRRGAFAAVHPSPLWERFLRWLRALFAPTDRADPGPAPSLSPGGLTAERPDLANAPIAWIPAEDSPVGTRVLDVRPITLSTLSMSRDPQMAQNAVSYGGEDGASFAAERLASARRVDATQQFDALLARGADPTRVAEGGHTPVSLVETRGHGALAERLRRGR